MSRPFSCPAGFDDHRDQRVISAARREVETCAVVRTLANQKGHLQHLLALQERELETIKRTKVRLGFEKWIA